MNNKKVTIDRHTFSLSNLNRMIFPKINITKGDVIGYYNAIAPLMLSHIENRPLTLQRFPEGIDTEGFFQKDASEYFPKWIKRFPVKKKEGGHTSYVVCNKQATLVYLANQACIVMHRWTSKITALTKPDLLIFDLDPSTKDFAFVRKIALELRIMLEEEKLVPFVMTTGGKGLHVLAPIKKKYDFEKVQAYAQLFADELVNKYPDKITTQMRKEKRGTRLFIDVHRIAFTATAVAPYSLRARENASVATPIEWDEVRSSRLKPDKYTIKNILKHVEKREDPWKNFFKAARTI